MIAGEFRSRKLKSVPGDAVRPTPDRLRESLFNILEPRIGGARFIDAYAGSGAVGIEALSRGARHACFIENNSQALAVIRENVEALGAGHRATILRGKAASLLPNHRADIAFIDPPYDREKEYGESLFALATAHCPYVIAQHTWRLTLNDEYGVLRKVRVLKQGSNALSFWVTDDEFSALA